MFKFVVGKYIKVPSLFLSKFCVFNLLNINKIDDNSSIISSVSVSNGTAKTTYSNRFEDLNKKILRVVTSKKIKIHDVAVSNGITSLELHQFLNESGIDNTLLFSDKYSQLYYKKDNNIYFYDADGNYNFGYINVLLASKFVSNFFFLTKWLYKLTQKKAQHLFNYNLPTVLLLHSKVSKFSDGNYKFQFSNHDLFKDIKPKEFDLVRAMNILNPIYFNSNQLNIALNLIYQSLNQDGILLVGRTHIEDGKNHASFYKKTTNGFSLLEHHNKGTEIDTLVQGFNLNE